MDRMASKESRRPRHPLMQQAMAILGRAKERQRSALKAKPTLRVPAVPWGPTPAFDPALTNLQRLMLRNLLKSSKRTQQVKAGDPMTWKELAMQAAEYEHALTRDDGAPGEADYLVSVIAKIRATPDGELQSLLEQTEREIAQTA